MMAKPIHVMGLTLHAIADSETDPYGQSGCSAVYAVVESTDSNLLQLFKTATDQSYQVTLKCARLEVDGRVTKIDDSSRSTKIILDVEDIRYLVPPSPEQRGLSRVRR